MKQLDINVRQQLEDAIKSTTKTKGWFVFFLDNRGDRHVEKVETIWSNTPWNFYVCDVLDGRLLRDEAEISMDAVPQFIQEAEVEWAEFGIEPADVLHSGFLPADAFVQKKPS